MVNTTLEKIAKATGVILGATVRIVIQLALVYAAVVILTYFSFLPL
jgi:hypothetical protein